MENMFTDMKVYPIQKQVGNLVGNGSVTVGNLVNVRFTIVRGSKGVFASLPSRKGTKPDESGKIPWYPEIKILNEDHFKEFQNMVKVEFAKALSNNSKQPIVKKNLGEEDQTEGYDDSLPF